MGAGGVSESHYLGTVQRYFLELAYHGGAYHGWQRQPDAPSVQQRIEEALGLLLRHDCPITGAGRTDTGVHAQRQFAHFETDEILPEDFIKRLNGILPADTAIARLLRPNDNNLHARYSALSRAYTYTLARRKHPFLHDCAWTLTRPLDLDAIAEATHIVLETTDFASFCKAGSDEKTTRCTLLDACWECHDRTVWAFHIRADRFLRGMVRAIVGTLVWVGQRRLSPSDVEKIIAEKNRKYAGPNAPAHGLALVDVQYPPGSLEEIAQIL